MAYTGTVVQVINVLGEDMVRVRMTVISDGITDQDIWNLRLSRASSDLNIAENAQPLTFAIRFVDPCLSVVLSAPTPASISTSVLAASPLISAGPTTSHSPYSSTNCGPLTFTLTYVDSSGTAISLPSTSIVDNFLSYSTTTGVITM